MKWIIRTLCLALALFLMTNCSPKMSPVAIGGVKYQTDESTGDIAALTSIGYATKAEEVLGDGIQRILKALLYNGIPNSPYRYPLLEENYLKTEHQSYLNSLINGGYADYVSDAWLLELAVKPKGSKTYAASVQVLVNVDGLRRELRTKGVIPKSGL